MRQFLKDENGVKLLAPRSRKTRLFQVAEIIERDTGIVANVVNTYDPITDKVWMGIQLLPTGKGEALDAVHEKMRALWEEFIG